MPGHRLPVMRHASTRSVRAAGTAACLGAVMLVAVGFVGLDAQASSAGQSGALSPSGLLAHQQLVTGTYTGAGLTLGNSPTGQVAVHDVVAGSPAEASGLKVGDVVVRVADADVSRSLTSEVAGLLRGTAASKVAVVVRRGADDVDVDLTRSDVASRDVHVRDLPDRTRVIRIDRFSAAVAERVADAVSEGPAPSGIVLDLRSNPGGLVDQAVSVASVFLDAGVVAVLDPVEAGTRRLMRTAGSALCSAPMVVLVDEGSASAAELLTGALQDRGRAVVVGTRTFGKGTVQVVSTAGAGGGSVTTLARYTTPDGHVVDGIGLTPDVALDDEATDDQALDAARSILVGLE